MIVVRSIGRLTKNKVAMTQRIAARVPSQTDALLRIPAGLYDLSRYTGKHCCVYGY